MERQGDEVHLDTREARAGGGPRSMRAVLVVSTLLAIVLLSALWITKAWYTTDAGETAQRQTVDKVVPQQGDAP